MRLNIPRAEVLLWLLPGALLGALIAMIPGVKRALHGAGKPTIGFALFACAINMAAAFA